MTYESLRLSCVYIYIHTHMQIKPNLPPTPQNSKENLVVFKLKPEWLKRN